MIVGGVLSFTSQVLAPAQKKSIELDTKTSILSSVLDIDSLNQVIRKEKLGKGYILEVYDQRIKSLVVDYQGNEITTGEKGQPIVAENVDVLKNYKKKPEDRQYPVYKYMNQANPDEVESYIFPLYGNGLWDKIWGYVALNSELKTIVGASFDHKQETPGLGARIATKEIQKRYVGKKIYNDQGELVSVVMVKGEGNSGLDSHHVDGMSGATMTGKGVNKMLKSYLECYQAYFKKVNSKLAQL